MENLLRNALNKDTSHPSRKSPLSLLYRSCAILLMVVITACGGGSSTGPEPDPDPPPNPDRPVSFSEDIQPIFNGNCAVSGCHDSGTQENGVNLSSYDAALNSVGVNYGTEIIDPEARTIAPLSIRYQMKIPSSESECHLTGSLLAMPKLILSLHGSMMEHRITKVHRHPNHLL